MINSKVVAAICSSHLPEQYERLLSNLGIELKYVNRVVDLFPLVSNVVGRPRAVYIDVEMLVNQSGALLFDAISALLAVIRYTEQLTADVVPTSVFVLVSANTDPAVCRELETISGVTVETQSQCGQDSPKSRAPEVILTHREQQILTLIQDRGASNKVIAKILNLSESTVKLHVGKTLKKYGCANRTQLALFSKTHP